MLSSSEIKQRMRTYFFLLAIIISTLYGCKKCDTDAISGDYSISGTSKYGQLKSDSTGTHWWDTTVIFTNRTIRFSKIDDSGISEYWPPSTQSSGDFFYNKDLSTTQYCCFILDHHGPGYGADTIWFYKKTDHAIKIHGISTEQASSGSIEATGYKIH